MKKYTVLDVLGEDSEYLEYENGNIATFDTAEEAIAVGKRVAEELRYNLPDSNIKKHYVQVNAEEVNEDGDIVGYIDSIERIDLVKDYQVELIDGTTGARSPIGVLSGYPTDYTVEDYISDCEDNANEEWVQMLKSNTVELIEIER